MYNKDADNSVTFLLADTKASFNVADDMWIWEKSSSKLGGLIKKQEQVIKYMPHTVSLEDMTVLLNIFDTIALEKYSKYLEAFIASQRLNLDVMDEENAFLN